MMVPMSKIGGRIVYSAFFFLAAILAWSFREWGTAKRFHFVPELRDGCGDSDLCFETQIVYRISAALAAFHLVMAAVMIGVSTNGDARSHIQDGWWGIKLILIFGSCIGMFFIPNSAFSVYSWIALVGAGFFVIVQLIFLVDFAHSWAENWIGKMEEDFDNDKKWFVALLVSTIFMFALSVAGTISMYVFFHHGGKNVAFITINIMICFLLSLLSIHPRVQEASPRSGLLQASVITAYSTYLIWSANLSDNDPKVNPFYKTSSASFDVSLFVGALFTIIAVIYATINTANNLGRSPETESLTKGNDEESVNDDEEKPDPDEPVPYNYSIFHLVFALGAMYIAMLMTDWSTVSHPHAADPKIDSGSPAFWVKCISALICCVLYVWTLAAPALLPDRFS